ncbi:MAG: TFIIB-type zinc ribbon-containing protein [Planctomycetota bacterium]
MKRERTSHTKDARGRRVTQLDPVALQLLRRQEPVDAATLDAITSEKGVRITAVERGAMILSIVLLLALLGVIASLLVRGQPWGGVLRRLGPTTYLFVWPFIVWGGMKRRRWGKIPAAMLKHFRCPHCGYDLRGLPADPEDGATVCPECGCAWRL